MAEDITNENLDEHITSYIDNEDPDSEIHRKVYEMISYDELTFKKYRSELLTKEIFRTRLQTADLPESTLARISNSIDGLIQNAIERKSSKDVEEESEGDYNNNFISYLIKLLATPVSIKGIAIPRYAFSLVILILIVGAVIFINNQGKNIPLNPYITNGTDKSVMVQAVNNFHKILSGEIKPELRSNNANDISTYLRGKLKYDAYIPQISNYNLMGATGNDYNGEKLAHLVYSSGDEILYIYETQTKSINHTCLDLPDPVHNEIIKERYYMCDKVDANNCCMFLWYKDNLLCASVSTMPKQQMYSTFTSLK
jgi:hypothetical protein